MKRVIAIAPLFVVLLHAQTSVEEVNRKQAALEERLSDLEERLSSNTTALIESMEVTYGPALLDAADGPDSYATAKSNGLPFLISLDRIEPYLTGFKLHFKVGNLVAATFSGFKLSVRPGLVGQDRSFQNYTQVLAPGSWTDVEFVLLDTPAATLRKFWVYLDINTVRLK
jgi:hypothetical protein